MIGEVSIGNAIQNNVGWVDLVQVGPGAVNVL
jgi:hypothetical protein